MWCGCCGQALLQTSQPFDKHAFNLALRRQVRLCLICLPYMSALYVCLQPRTTVGQVDLVWGAYNLSNDYL